ncbi:MAG: transposase [Treponema sp.]|nr:transposase [Treponema sp.]
MRKTYDKAFKAKIALEALRGGKTLQKIAITYGVHPNLVRQWKTLLLENAVSIFEKSGKETSWVSAARPIITSLKKRRTNKNLNC